MQNISLFFRAEHSEEINHDLSRYKSNCDVNKEIFCGPWLLLDFFSDEEVNYMASVSVDHALPYQRPGRPFDEEINSIVMGPGGKQDQLIKEEFIFGCASRALLDQYFPPQFRQILHSHGFHVGIYSSCHVHTSQHQSVMDISKPFKFIGNESLT